jgi:aminopeptidase N
MRQLLKSAATAAAIAFASSPAFAIDPFFPTFGNLGIDVQHYDIGLDVDPVSGRIIGQTYLVVQAKDRLSSFSLDLHALKVSHVKIDGRPVAFSQANDKLTVKGFGALKKGRVFAVTVNYAGVPDPLPDPTVGPDDGLYLGWFKYQNSTYVVSEPVGASTFFPANDDLTDKATYSFRLTVPKGYTAVANGAPNGRGDRGVKNQFRWSMRQPMEAWLATVHVNKFSVAKARTANGIPVRTYYPAGVPASHVEVYQKPTEMIPFYEKLIGPYPFQSYGSAVSQDPILYYFLETQAMSTLPAETDPANLPDEGIIAHELIHQWIGNSVSVARWEDLWFAEGLATYFEVLWPNRDDPAAFDAAMRAIYDDVAARNVGPAVVDAPDQLFTSRTYERGGSAMYALQLQIGQQKFFDFLKQFLRENRNGTITSRDFINAAVRITGDKAVGPLLEAWLYDPPVPALPDVNVTLRRAPAPMPDILGNRCGRGSHRGAPKTCAPAATN